MSNDLGRPLLTPEQAAKHLAISTRQLRDLATDGSIRYVNIGRHDRETRRYSPEDLEAFIEERKRRASQASQRSPGPTNYVYGRNAFLARLDARSSSKGRRTAKA